MEEEPVCLWAQIIDDNDGVVDRVRQAHGLSDDNRVVGRGRRIHDKSKG